MSYSLKQAAEATGKSKPTILRAIQSGKVSAKKDDNGEWQIDPAELHRVYPVAEGTDTRTDTQQEHEIVNETAMLRREIEIRDERLAAVEEERERERRQSEDTINDLRRRLDTEGEERRKLTALLTDQRKQADNQAQEAAERVSWWSRLFRPARS